MLGDVPQTETVQWFVSQLLQAGLKHTDLHLVTKESL